MVNEEERTPHEVSQVKCRLCGNVHTAVFPTSADPEFLQCPVCGNMSCEEIEDKE